jgi:hypothetical protein
MSPNRSSIDKDETLRKGPLDMKQTFAAFVLIFCVSDPAWAEFPSPSAWGVLPSPAAITLPSDAEIATADFSSLPLCDQFGSDIRDSLGRRWQIDFTGNEYKLLIDGVWYGGRAHALMRQGTNIYKLAVNNRLFRMVTVDSKVLTWGGEMGCRLPTSLNGSSVLQQNTYLVDAMGGTWIAACSEETTPTGAPLYPATYCPDFPGATQKIGMVVRNGYHLPPNGLWSMPEPYNAPWNLKWCDGKMFVHFGNSDRTIHQAGVVTVSPGSISVRPATPGECGYLTTTTSPPAPPTNVRVVR